MQKNIIKRLTEVEDSLITLLRGSEGKKFLEQLIDMYVKSENKGDYEQVRHVSKMLSWEEFKEKSGPIKILSDDQLEFINIKLKEGYNLAIIGTTGSGKSTALRNILEAQPSLKYIVAGESTGELPLRDDCICKIPSCTGYVPALDIKDTMFLMKNKESLLILDGTIRDESGVSSMISTLNMERQVILTMQAEPLNWQSRFLIMCRDEFLSNWIRTNIMDESAKYKFITIKTFINPETHKRTAEILLK